MANTLKKTILTMVLVTVIVMLSFGWVMLCVVVRDLVQPVAKMSAALEAFVEIGVLALALGGSVLVLVAGSAYGYPRIWRRDT